MKQLYMSSCMGTAQITLVASIRGYHPPTDESVCETTGSSSHAKPPRMLPSRRRVPYLCKAPDINQRVSDHSESTSQTFKTRLKERHDHSDATLLPTMVPQHGVHGTLREKLITRCWRNGHANTLQRELIVEEPSCRLQQSPWRAARARQPLLRGVLFTPPVGYSGSLSTVNETNCNKKIEQNIFVSSLPTPFGCVRTTTRNLEMKANITILYVGQLERWTGNLPRNVLVLVVCVFVDLDGWALQLVLLIRGVSEFSSWQRL